MTSFAKLTALGNAGGDAELRYLADGTPVASFSVAINERRQISGESQEMTTWYRVSCWRRLAEIAAEQVRKGCAVYVEGPLQVREYTGADGQKRWSLDLRARELHVINGRVEQETGQASHIVDVPDPQEGAGDDHEPRAEDMSADDAALFLLPAR